MAHYRWLLRTILPNLVGYWHDLREGLRNLRVFWVAVWDFRAFDYTGLLTIIETAAKEMRACHERLKMTEDWERCARDLTVLADVCRRLRDDNYFDKGGNERSKRDVEQLGASFKRLRHWWN